MKKQYLASLAAATLLILGACQKEEPAGTTSGAKRTPIYVENFESATGEKTAVLDGQTVYWRDGDKIYAYNSDREEREYTVRVDANTGEAYIEEEIPSGWFSAVYGYNQTSNAGISLGNVVGLTLPNNYDSYFDDDGKQVIKLPMAGYRESGTGGITFKHLSAAVNVKVRNESGKPLHVTKASVSLDRYQSLAYGSYIDFSWEENWDGSNRSYNESNATVTVNLTTPLELAIDETKTFQIPIGVIFNSVDAQMTLTVDAYTDEPERAGRKHCYRFSYASDAVPVDRNQVLEAKIKFDPANSSKITTTTHGLFSVSSTKKVYFSRGNLTIDPGYGSYEGYNPFSFWDEQYKYSGNKGSNYYISTVDILNERTPPQDLFCWGTGNSPRTRETTGTVRWGTGNIPIIVDGETLTGWTLLTANEWNYLFHTRKQAGTNANLYFKARIYDPNGIIGSVSPTITYANGYILLPDDWSGTIPSTTPTLSPDEWKNNYEALGAVFLPLAGGRAYSISATGDTYPDIDIHTTGYYWISDGTVYHLPKHSATTDSPNALTLQGNRLKDGYTVRMVKTYN